MASQFRPRMAPANETLNGASARNIEIPAATRALDGSNDRTDANGQTERVTAVCCGDTARVERLLAAGARGGLKDSDGNTELLQAALNWYRLPATVWEHEAERARPGKRDISSV